MFYLFCSLPSLEHVERAPMGAFYMFSLLSPSLEHGCIFAFDVKSREANTKNASQRTHFSCSLEVGWRVGKAVRVSKEDDEQTKHAHEGMFCVFVGSEKKPNTKNMPTRVCFLCSLREAG